MRLMVVGLVFVAELWALWRIFGSRASRARRTAWTAAVVALPIAGLVAWTLSGPRGT